LKLGGKEKKGKERKGNKKQEKFKNEVVAAQSYKIPKIHRVKLCPSLP